MIKLSNDIDRVDAARRQINAQAEDKKLLLEPVMSNNQLTTIMLRCNLATIVAVDRKEIEGKSPEALIHLLRQRLISQLRDMQDALDTTLERLKN